MNLFPNYAAQRRPFFTSRYTQPPSVVKRLYIPPEQLGAAPEPDNLIQTPTGTVMIWPSRWNPTMDPTWRPISAGQIPASGQFNATILPQPAAVTVTASTPVQSTPAVAATPSDAAATQTIVAPSSVVSATPAATASFSDEISAWLNAQMISGVPNYWLAIAAAGGVLLLMRKGKR